MESGVCSNSLENWDDRQWKYQYTLARFNKCFEQFALQNKSLYHYEVLGETPRLAIIFSVMTLPAARGELQPNVDQNVLISLRGIRAIPRVTLGAYF